MFILYILMVIFFGLMMVLVFCYCRLVFLCFLVGFISVFFYKNGNGVFNEYVCELRLSLVFFFSFLKIVVLFLVWEGYFVFF